MCIEIEQLAKLENEFINIEKPLFDEDYTEEFLKSNVTPIIKRYYNPERNYSKEQLDLFELFKFTELDLTLLIAFTGNASKYINHELASPKPKLNEHQEIIVNSFDNTLKKINKCKENFVYRMDKFSKGRENHFIKFYERNISKIINVPWFLSTTTDSQLWGVKIIWKIKLLNEKDTKARIIYPLINNHGDEFEIRFERNSKFLIKSVIKVNENYYINMEEINVKNFDLSLTYYLT